MKKALKKKALKKKDRIKLIFPFDRRIINEIKLLPGREYDPGTKTWTVPIVPSVVDKLRELDFDISDKLETSLKENTGRRVKKADWQKLKLTPYKYQRTGIRKLFKFDGNALLADDMGLGKTLQALAYVAFNEELKNILIICPASLKYNWFNEIKKSTYLNQPIHVLQGKTASKITYSDEGIICIINYDIVSDWKDQLKELQFDILLMDEAHKLKNNKTQRSRAVKTIAKGIDKKIAITGTPIENRPFEIFNCVNIINPYILPPFWTFVAEFCGFKNGTWDRNGAQNTDKLHGILKKSIMIRRTKDRVLKQLPPKTRSYIPLEITNRKEYNRAESNFSQFVRNTEEQNLKSELQKFKKQNKIEGEFGEDDLKEAVEHKVSKVNILTEIEGLKQLAVKGKLKQIGNWIDDFLEETDKKLVIFGVHKFLINELYEKYKKIAVKIDGSTPVNKRQSIVEQFQKNDRTKLIILNIKAGGEGITLTAASDVLITELPWTPATLDQAEDRCHRISQLNHVTIYYLLGLNTIEEKIAKLLDEKRKVTAAVIDGKQIESADLITEVLKEYKSL